MSDQTELKASLIKPAFVFFALILLNLAAAIAINHSAHIKPYWRRDIHDCTTCIYLALIGGWFLYVKIRRCKASRQQ